MVLGDAHAVAYFSHVIQLITENNREVEKYILWSLWLFIVSFAMNLGCCEVFAYFLFNGYFKAIFETLLHDLNKSLLI